MGRAARGIYDKGRDRFWAIQEELFNDLGYRDYLGALQRFRAGHPYEPHVVVQNLLHITLCGGSSDSCDKLELDIDLREAVEGPGRSHVHDAL